MLIAGADGKPRHDFHRKLSFSWPCTAAQLQLHEGHANHDPLFVPGTASALDLSIAEVRLGADPTDAVCPTP